MTSIIEFPTGAPRADPVTDQINELVRNMRIELATAHLEHLASRANRRTRRPSFRRDQSDHE